MAEAADGETTFSSFDMFSLWGLGNNSLRQLEEFTTKKHEWLAEVLEEAKMMCAGKKVTQPFPVTPRKRTRRARGNNTDDEKAAPASKRQSKLVLDLDNIENDVCGTTVRRTTRATKKRNSSKSSCRSDTSCNNISEMPTTTRKSRRKMKMPASEIPQNSVAGDHVGIEPERVPLTETNSKKQLGKKDSFVKQQVKVIEEKICTSLLEEPRSSPIKLKKSLARVVEYCDAVEANRLSIRVGDDAEKSYISVLSPLTLSAKKQLLSVPIVVCSPYRPVMESCDEREELLEGASQSSRRKSRRSSVRRETRCLTNQRRALTSLSTATFSERSIMPPSKRRTSVVLSKIRASLMLDKRRSSVRRPASFSSVSRNTTAEIEEKHSDLENSVESKENVHPTDLPTPEGSDSEKRQPSSSPDSQNASDEEYIDEDVIETTPSPKCPKNKVVRPKPQGSKRAMVTRSVRRVLPASEDHKLKHVSRLPKKSFTPLGKRTPMTPLSANKGNIFSPMSQNRFPFGRSNYQSPLSQEMQLREQQRRHEIRMKEEKEKEILRIRQEKLKKKLDEQKKKREARMQRALDARKQKEREQLEMQQRLEREQEERLNTKERQREEKIRQEAIKKSQYLKQKAADAVARRKQEEEARLQKLKEQQEEEQRYQQLLQRKKEFEFQQQREKELRQIKEKELATQQKNEALKQKRAKEEEEFKKIASEKIITKPAEQDNEVSILSVHAADETFNLTQPSEEKMNPLNATYNSSPADTEVSKTQLNSTFNKTAPAPSCDNYQISPEKKRSYGIPLKNPDNYDISLLCSEDSTDDESEPRKQIPAWASGLQLRTALIVQLKRPPDLDELFPEFDFPDLTKIFKKKRARYMQRTSSAIWNSPILKHSEFDS